MHIILSPSDAKEVKEKGWASFTVWPDKAGPPKPT